ncbi:MAG: hypothetical protein ACF8R7_02125 [Phycisphaerales bacterium JB039]
MSDPLPVAWLGQPGARIGLAITGYQFAGPVRSGQRDWDANWLNVRGHVECAAGAWSFEDPCLVTWELAALIDWVEALPDPPGPRIAFTEPLLALSNQSIDDAIVLGVRLGAEALPADRFDEVTRLQLGLTIDLQPSMGQLQRAVQALRAFLQRYPER